MLGSEAHDFSSAGVRSRFDLNRLDRVDYEVSLLGVGIIAYVVLFSYGDEPRPSPIRRHHRAQSTVESDQAEIQRGSAAESEAGIHPQL